MKGGRFLFIGGVLLFAIGVILLVNNIIALNNLDPVPKNENPQWYAIINTFGVHAFRWFTVIMPVIFILAGVIGILRFWFFVGVTANLITLSIILLAGMVGRARIFLVPFYENLGEWFGFSARFTSWAYWISIMILAGLFQFFLLGMEAGANDGHNSFTITRAITRSLYLLMFLPLCYMLDWLAIPEDMPPLVFIVYCLLFIPIFKSIRGLSGESSIKMILLTFAAALALPFYSVGIFMIHPFVLPIYNFIVYFPLAAILVYIGRGRTLPMSSAEVARLEDKRRRAEYTAGWNRVRMWGWEEPNWQGKLK